MFGGHVQPAAVMVTPELLVCAGALGAAGRAVSHLRRWKIQDRARMHRVLQHDGWRLYRVLRWDVLYDSGPQHQLQRLPCGDVFAGRGDGVPNVRQRDVLAGPGRDVCHMRSGLVRAGEFERVRGVPCKHLSGRGWEGLGARLSALSRGNRELQAGQQRPRVQRLPPWHLPSERGVRGLPGGDLFAVRVCPVQGLSGRYVLAWQRDVLSGVPAGPDQRGECQRDVQCVPTWDVLGLRRWERVRQVRDRVCAGALGGLELHAVRGWGVCHRWREPVQPVRGWDMGCREHRELGGVRRVRGRAVLDRARRV